jgi:hypothetical protein
LAVLGWPVAAAAHVWPANAGPDRPGEPIVNGAACATGASRPSVTTTTPYLAVRQSDPDAGQASLTTTFVWWRVGGLPGGIDRASASGGNPGVVSVAVGAGRLVDGGTYAWRARTFDGSRYGHWSARCEFTVDVTPPPPPGGVTSTDYPSDGFHGGVGVPGQFTIGPPLTRPEEVVAYAWTVDGATGPGSAPTVPADPDTHGATLTFTPVRDGIHTLRVWSEDRAGLFSPPVSWTFGVSAADPGPGPTLPAPPTITFPAGNTALAGGTLSVRLDANGDTSVTEFRYSVGVTNQNLLAVPDEPGGSVVLAIPAGPAAGQRSLYARSGTATATSAVAVATFEVLPTSLWSGRVVDFTTFLPVEGAVVRMEPGGYATTTNADGEFTFSSDVPAGLYTVTAAAAVGCASPWELLIEAGLYIELYLFPDACGS